MDGVSIEDPETAYISPDIKIGRDTVVMPNTTIVGKCEIGEANFIGPNTVLKDVVVGHDNYIHNSVLVNVKVGNKQTIGPYSNIRDQEIK